MQRSVEESSFPPYVLKDGKFYFSDSSNSVLIISDGVIEFTTKLSMGYGVYAYLNVSDIDQNTKDQATADNINNKPALFTIPDGAECVLTLNAFSNDSSTTYAGCKLGLRKAESSEFIVVTGLTRYEGTSVTWTQEGSVDVGCVCVLAHNLSWNAKISNLTIGLTVNGEKWV